MTILRILYLTETIMRKGEGRGGITKVKNRWGVEAIFARFSLDGLEQLCYTGKCRIGGTKRETMLVSVPGMSRAGVEDRNHRDTENKENTGSSRLVLRVFRVLRLRRVSAASAVCVDVLGTL